MRSVYILLLSLSLNTQASTLTVLIDAGHGGRDRGATQHGTNEADVTLAVTQNLRALLTADPHFRVFVTRDTDQGVSLYRRAQIASIDRAELYLSVHVNSSPDPKAKGAEFYFQNQLPPDEESMFLAHKENVAEAGENVQPIEYEFLKEHSYPSEVRAIVNDLLDGERILHSSQLAKSLKLSWQGPHKSKSNSIRQAPFYVLNQMRVPSTLVELGFLTNADDYAQLTDPKIQKKMAQDLYRGILSYKESIDKANQRP